MFPRVGTHITRDMCFPSGGTHIARDMCFPSGGTHITRDMCFPSGGTHITRDMFFPDGGTHITRDICFAGGGTHITRDMCFPGGETDITRDMCFPGGGTQIFRDICFPCGGTRITRDMCFPVGEDISLGVCVSQVGEHISHRKLIFGTRQLLSRVSDMQVPSLDRELTPFCSMKDLSITLDSYLNFNYHVRHLLTKPVLSTILNSLIFSKLFYCMTIWAGTSKQNLQKLQLVQNFSGRVLTDTKTFDHISPVLWELVRPFIKYQLLVRDSTQQHQEKGQSKSLSMQNNYCSTVILLSLCTCLELSDRRH